MTTEDFNALPLEARRYIEDKISCLSCGGNKDLDFHYKNYLSMSIQDLYTLRNGAVHFNNKETKESGMLYSISDNDSEDQKVEKLKTALTINEVYPDAFQSIDILKIQSILNGEDSDNDSEDQKVEEEAEVKKAGRPSKKE